jgi:hypothetical protein
MAERFQMTVRMPEGDESYPSMVHTIRFGDDEHRLMRRIFNLQCSTDPRQNKRGWRMAMAYARKGVTNG